MARDMDLVRQILMQASKADDSLAPRRPVAVDGVEEHVIARHVEMMHEAGLIVAQVARYEGYGAMRAIVERVTWEGHDFLDAARDQDVWNKAKQQIVIKGGAFTFSVLKSLLQHEIRQRLGIEL